MLNFFKSFYNLIRFFILEKNKKEFVFFSESRFYRDHFTELIDQLKKKNQNNIILITSDEEDDKFFKNKINCFYIKNYFILSLLFKLISCKFIIMTLTDLGSHLKKSKNCKFYVYFFHAMASTHQIYTKTAFNNYDIILTNGEYQSKELKLTEEKLNLPKKEIVNTGYFYFDYLLRSANFAKKEKKHVLFAPSWNYNNRNLFDDYSIDIISLLLENNFKFTLRPHPEHYKRSKNTIGKIKNLFLNKEQFFLDKNLSNLNSLEKAEILITDNSSIVFEFLLIFKRPIIYLDYQDKVHNTDINKIKIETIDYNLKKNFGSYLNISNLKNLPSLCEELGIKNNLSNEKINLFSNNYLSNFGNSAEFASDYLIKKSKNN